MSELVWVAVPNGLIPNPGGGIPTKASIRVLIVPRLTGANIGEDGLQDWPALAAETDFTLWTKTSLGVQIAAHRPRYVARARSEVWTGFFGGDAGLVDPYAPKTNPVPEVAPSYSDARNVAMTYRSVSRVAAVPANDADSAIRSALTAWAAPEPERRPPPADPPTFGIPDFHATVSRLREHPTVLLDLGLVFEVIVDVADLAVGTAAGRQLSIRCDDPPTLVGLVTAPWTRYDLDLTPPVTGFWPAPGSASGIGNGLLDLSQSTSITSPTAPADPARWAVATFDIDGVVGKLRQTGRDLAADPQADATMPAMRSARLALLRPDRGLDFAGRARTAQYRAERDMAETVFTAEDLVLGYRVDIRRESNPWRSLCERDAEYKIDGLLIGPPGPVAGRVREEGHVKGFAAVKSADGGLHADEVVVRWGGWSVAVPLPNLRGDTSGPGRDPGTPLPYRFELDFAIPQGRLPALRFSNLYRMRIRIADIAGGGLELGDTGGNQAASAGVIYRRHDPIQPPRLRGAGPFAPGAAIDRMVVRSDKNLTPEQLHAMDPDYPLVESRILDPPTAPLQIVEQHGMFDPPMNDEQSFALVQRAMGADASGAGLPDPVAEGVNAVVRAEPGGLAREISDDDKWSPGWPGPQAKTIELRPHANQPDPVTIGWSANTLKVTLGQAEQATIELSSIIPGDMSDHLAVTDYLSDPPISPEQTLLGRNPVVTPPRRILVVHAVRSPMAEPEWNLPGTAIERGPGATDVVLNAAFTPADSGFGLHTDSTGRLEVAATWTEVEDAGDEASIGRRPAPAWFANAASARQVMLSESGTPVTIIPVDVTPAGDRWYADVEFTVPAAAASYNPFVRLAVARYQPDSIDELHLSPVVVTDTVPLLPDRHVVITRTGNQLGIGVDGLSPNPLNRLEALLESCGPGIRPEDLDVAIDDATTEPQLSAWRPVANGRVVRSDTGLIPPLTLVSTPGRLRIRLRETENIPGVEAGSPPDLTRRNVFVDTIVLPEGWRPA